MKAALPPQAPGQNWTLCTTICKADSDWGSFYGWGTRAGLEFYPQNKRFYVLVDGSVHPPRVSLLAWAARDAFNTDMIWIPTVANYIINCNPQKKCCSVAFTRYLSLRFYTYSVFQKSRYFLWNKFNFWLPRLCFSASAWVTNRLNSLNLQLQPPHCKRLSFKDLHEEWY